MFRLGRLSQHGVKMDGIVDVVRAETQEGLWDRGEVAKIFGPCEMERL